MATMWMCSNCFKDVVGNVFDNWDKTTNKALCDACKKKEE